MNYVDEDGLSSPDETPIHEVDRDPDYEAAEAWGHSKKWPEPSSELVQVLLTKDEDPR